MSVIRCFLLLVSSVAVLTGCARKNSAASDSNRRPITIAIAGDIDSFNPLFAEDVTAGEINDLLFPGLVGSSFDTSKGMLIYTPLLARSWEFKAEHCDLLFHLRSGAMWSDGQPVSARDVQFSYELYGDPEVGSVRQGSVSGLRGWQGKPDITRSVEILDDTTVVFHFEMASPSQLFDAGLPILPAHVLAAIPRKELRTHEINRSPVVSGPFRLERWTPLEGVILASNPSSTLPFPARASSLVFRVVPEYRTRVSQLAAGEVDVVADIRPEDAGTVSASAVRLVATPGRDYDFLGWNNIDPALFQKSGGKTVRPHPLFGSAPVRRALTMAIDRASIVKSYLGSYGHEATGGISPLFKWAYNDTLKPLPFDRAGAAALLEQEGWRDSDGDGILEKNGKRFSFSLKVSAGNALRNAVATAVQQQLHDVKVEMTIEQVERGTFWDNLTARRYDAWLAGFSVPLQMKLDDLWGSDLAKYPFNVTGFRNARVDSILAASRRLQNETDGASLWKQFQDILSEEQPCTFLFWIDSITGVSTRVRGTSIGILGTTHEAWNWSLENQARDRLAQAR
jgi:peptide/nickel transport system substrate-binding protein